MTTAPSPAPADTPGDDDHDDAGRWREAARLRREHLRWVVIDWRAPCASSARTRGGPEPGAAPR